MPGNAGDGKMKIGLIGCGNIGGFIARHIDKSDRFELCCVYDVDKRQARKLKSMIVHKPKVVNDVPDMKGCDLVIEAASQEAVRDHALEVLGFADMMIMSTGTFSDGKLFEEVKKKASREGRKVYIPSGAIIGLDGVKAAKLAGIKRVTLTTRKPPERLENSPWVLKNDIRLRSIRKPTVIFEGSAKDAAYWFPKNVNVAVALSLAGIGAEKTRVKVMADPFIERNTHEIEVEGKSGTLHCITENEPSPNNPKTSYLAALSAIRMLENLGETVVIGT